jgi:hypothetical protein
VANSIGRGAAEKSPHVGTIGKSQNKKLRAFGQREAMETSNEHTTAKFSKYIKQGLKNARR